MNQISLNKNAVLFQFSFQFKKDILCGNKNETNYDAKCLNKIKLLPSYLHLNQNALSNSFPN